MKNIKYLLKDFDLIHKAGEFDERSTIAMSDVFLKRLQIKQAKLSIIKMGNSEVKPFLNVEIGDFTGELKILSGSNGVVKLGFLGNVNLDFRVGHDSRIFIGDKTTATNARIVAINSDVIIGEDCMFSDGVLIQAFDQHGIVDLKTGEIINNFRGMIEIGNHVWLGRNCSISPNTKIYSGCIVGMESLVTKNVEANTLVGGNPAKLIRSDVSWCRPWTNIDSESRNCLEKYKKSN